jgi:hypothetical protein
VKVANSTYWSGGGGAGGAVDAQHDRSHQRGRRGQSVQ